VAPGGEGGATGVAVAAPAPGAANGTTSESEEWTDEGSGLETEQGPAGGAGAGTNDQGVDTSLSALPTGSPATALAAAAAAAAAATAAAATIALSPPPPPRRRRGRPRKSEVEAARRAAAEAVAASAVAPAVTDTAATAAKARLSPVVMAFARLGAPSGGLDSGPPPVCATSTVAGTTTTTGLRRTRKRTVRYGVEADVGAPAGAGSRDGGGGGSDTDRSVFGVGDSSDTEYACDGAAEHRGAGASRPHPPVGPAPPSSLSFTQRAGGASAFTSAAGASTRSGPVREHRRARLSGTTPPTSPGIGQGASVPTTAASTSTSSAATPTASEATGGLIATACAGLSSLFEAANHEAAFIADTASPSPSPPPPLLPLAPPERPVSSASAPRGTRTSPPPPPATPPRVASTAPSAGIASASPSPLTPPHTPDDRRLLMLLPPASPLESSGGCAASASATPIAGTAGTPGGFLLVGAGLLSPPSTLSPYGSPFGLRMAPGAGTADISTAGGGGAVGSSSGAAGGTNAGSLTPTSASSSSPFGMSTGAGVRARHRVNGGMGSGGGGGGAGGGDSFLDDDSLLPLAPLVSPSLGAGRTGSPAADKDLGGLSPLPLGEFAAFLMPVRSLLGGSTSSNGSGGGGGNGATPLALGSMLHPVLSPDVATPFGPSPPLTIIPPPASGSGSLKAAAGPPSSSNTMLPSFGNPFLRSAPPAGAGVPGVSGSAVGAAGSDAGLFAPDMVSPDALHGGVHGSSGGTTPSHAGVAASAAASAASDGFGRSARRSLAGSLAMPGELAATGVRQGSGLLDGTSKGESISPTAAAANGPPSGNTPDGLALLACVVAGADPALRGSLEIPLPTASPAAPLALRPPSVPPLTSTPPPPLSVSRPPSAHPPPALSVTSPGGAGSDRHTPTSPATPCTPHPWRLPSSPYGRRLPYSPGGGSASRAGAGTSPASGVGGGASAGGTPAVGVQPSSGTSPPALTGGISTSLEAGIPASAPVGSSSSGAMTPQPADGVSPLLPRFHSNRPVAAAAVPPGGLLATPAPRAAVPGLQPPPFATALATATGSADTSPSPPGPARALSAALDPTASPHPPFLEAFAPPPHPHPPPPIDMSPFGTGGVGTLSPTLAAAMSPTDPLLLGTDLLPPSAVSFDAGVGMVPLTAGALAASVDAAAKSATSAHAGNRASGHDGGAPIPLCETPTPCGLLGGPSRSPTPLPTSAFLRTPTGTPFSAGSPMLTSGTPVDGATSAPHGPSPGPPAALAASDVSPVPSQAQVEQAGGSAEAAACQTTPSLGHPSPTARRAGDATVRR